MGKKLIGIAVIAIMLFGIFGLAGCEGFNLDEYKANAEAAIQTHASTKIAEYDYTNAGLQAIAKAVADGKDAVDVADNKGRSTRQ